MTDLRRNLRPPKLVLSGLVLGFSPGGIHTYLRSLANGLCRVYGREEMRLLVPEQSDLEGLRPEIAVETTPRKLARQRPLLSEMASGLALGQITARRYPEAVFFTPNEFWALSAPRRRIAVIHDAIPAHSRINAGSPLRRFHRRMCLRYARKATRWVSVSEHAAADLGRLEGRGRIPLALPNWVDERFENPVPPAAVQALRQRLGLPEWFFLYVGGYRKYKNVELLIRAHAAAARRATIPPLVLAGKATGLNPMTQPCDVAGEMQRCQSPAGSVLLPGFVADDDLPALYSAATLFVSASLQEGFGYPPVEAMAMGCPVLVADRTSFTEVVPCASSRFDPNDEAGLTQLLIKAAADSSFFRCPFPVRYSRDAGIARVVALIEDVLREQA